MTAHQLTQRDLFGQDPLNDVLATSLKHQSLTREQCLAVIAAYQDGASGKRIAEKAGLNYRTILKTLEREGIARRIGRPAGIPNLGTARKYAVNADFFAQPVRSQLVAYVAGFIAGDGCVATGRPRRKSYQVRITLSGKDADHLGKIRQAVGADAPVALYEDSRGFSKASLAFCSRKIVEDLAQLGIGPRKSFTLDFWTGPPELAHAFFLGMFDADGCLQKVASKRDGEGSLVWSLDLCGTLAICTAFSQFIEKLTRHRQEPHRHGRIWRTKVARRRVVHAVLAEMYRDAVIWLDRKKALADEALACHTKIRDWTAMTRPGLEAMLAEHKTWHGVADVLGTTLGNLAHVRRRLGLL